MPHHETNSNLGRMQQEEHLSCLMVFCALLLVRNAKATVEESLHIIPLFGPTRYLAIKMFRPSVSP